MLTAEQIVDFEELVNSGADISPELLELVDLALKQYEPFPMQRKFHESKARERWAFTANRVGKTAMGSNEAGWHASGEYPDWYPDEGKSPIPNNGRILAPDFANNIEKIIIPEFVKWFPHDRYGWELRVSSRRMTWPNGSVIDFMSADPTVDISKHGGTACHWVWIDEPIIKKYYTEAKMRYISTGGRLWATMTLLPLAGASSLGFLWEYEDIIEGVESGLLKGVEIFHGSIYDNPLNTKEIIEEVFQGVDKVERAAREFGKLLVNIGRVYKELNEEAHIVKDFEIPPDWPLVTVIDPHEREPTYVDFFVIAPDDRLYLIDYLILPNMTVPQMAEQIMDYEDSLGCWQFKRYIDPNLGIQKSNTVEIDLSIREQFQREGMPTYTVSDTLTAGHKRVRRYLAVQEDGKPGLFFFESTLYPKSGFDLSHTPWYQMTHYVWDDWKSRQEERALKEKVKDKNKHHPDNIRYACMADLRFVQPQKSGDYRYRVSNSRTGY